MEITRALELLLMHLSNRFLSTSEKTDILEQVYDLSSKYEVIGIGRSRIVFSYNDQTVLKFSFVEAQSMQNALEVAASSRDMDKFYELYSNHYVKFNNLGHSVDKVKTTLNEFFGGVVPIAETTYFSGDSSGNLVLQEKIQEVVSDCYDLPEELRKKWGEFQFRFDGLQAGFTSHCELKAFDL